ncbi:kinase-like domain-containing protein [Pisolithus microcarpus]|nr:kinase-like domain-containing protein [Pisolithus microcarpus]
MQCPLSWAERKVLLDSLLRVQDDDEEGLALDRVLHGQNVVGKNVNYDQDRLSLRFCDKDLVALGTLDHGQFGVVRSFALHSDLVEFTERLSDRRGELRFGRTCLCTQQCSPQIERDILLLAKRGYLWDVLESSPLNGRISESDVLWWAPQAVCAIHWCHSQGFAHRDIKPHNFVLTPNYRLLLIDFGSAAPLQPPQPDGSQLIPQQYCLVPCGTCDYISPEILQAHEDALFYHCPTPSNTICGLETDWWSLGVMIYELAFGITPFFAKDIRTTYLRIVDHETNLKFDKTVAVSGNCRDLLRRFHPFFANVDWSVVGREAMPSGIHVPQFAYSTPSNGIPGPVLELPEDSQSHPFAFSALFQSSADHSSPGISALRSVSRTGSSSGSIQSEAAFIGFSWGPSKDTFLSPSGSVRGGLSDTLMTPRPLGPVQSRLSSGGLERVPSTHLNAFTTPIRPYNLSPYHTLPRPSTIRCTASRRAVSDREAMQQLVDCIGMSARKKVLASGRKPRVLDSFSRNSSSTIRKELRFGPPPIVPTKSFDSTDFPPVNASIDLDGSESGSEGPPSPSPSPRPGSAMSTLSRRSVTPTTTVSYSARLLGIPSASQSVISQEPSGLYSPVEWRDDAISLLEERHTALLSRLGEIQLRLDDLRETIEW